MPGSVCGIVLESYCHDRSVRGVIAVKQPPALLLDVAGVGSEIEAPMSTFYELPEVGREVTAARIWPSGRRPFALRLCPGKRAHAVRALIKVSGVAHELRCRCCRASRWTIFAR